METMLDLKAPKRGDLVAEQVKRWITERNLGPGDKLPKENELQQMFSVSRGTTREALKSLEVQGLIRLSTGPNGGATIAEVPLGRTLQFVQNYLFFQDLSVEDVYAARRIVEPEIAAGAVENLTDADLEALERSIAVCAPVSTSQAHALEQRQEDLHFHDILARANRNAFLRLIGEMINQMLRQLVVLGGNAAHEQYQRFGRENVKAHRAILDAIRSGDIDSVRKLMVRHIIDAERHVKKLQGVIRGRLVLDSDVDFQLRSRSEPLKRTRGSASDAAHQGKTKIVKRTRREKT
ncbi:FCD domain-containing protein [Bradyrhizobium sp. ISRA443]|nr:MULTISPECIES: FCD domain-containing protein [unclassified Bradyrhizobium]WGR93004.1 FCD domain-containing protein [Bradyrhizobium sp. ISRA435]WGS04386.1 FCD domain-containing protein [Bradyrhizobium sp. ISRA437]WGS11268.1 FCD domain-containing protein [Bradyrhizobium sp. ISRA443]